MEEALSRPGEEPMVPEHTEKEGGVVKSTGRKDGLREKTVQDETERNS